MKKMVSFLMAVVLLIALTPVGAITVSAATSGKTGDCTWTLDGTHLTISGKGAMADYTGINTSGEAPWGTRITSVIIEEGVTKIGRFAFPWTMVGEVTIPDSVVEIGEHAFEYNEILYSLTLGKGLETVGTYSFMGCRRLTSVVIPDNVININGGAFTDCVSLKSVVIGSGVKHIGQWAFDGCKNLSSVSFEGMVDTIELDVFTNTEYYDNPTNWENDVLYIENNLIDAKHTLSGTYAIKEGTHAIAYGAFTGCKNLECVIIPNGVLEIKRETFLSCSSLKTIVIPDSVSVVDRYAFESCKSLEKVYYSGSQTASKKISINNYGNTPLNKAVWFYDVRILAGHVYDNCDDAICNVCEKEREELHEYTDIFDTVCNNCGAIREVEIPLSFGGNSTHESVVGLAFRFDVSTVGMATDTDNVTAMYGNATVDGYTLLGMGAMVTNEFDTRDVPAVYLCELKESAASFAVRIVNIPAFALDIDITATPYIILEIDGVATTIYGEAQTCSYNDVMN